MTWPMKRLRYLATFNPPVPASVRTDAEGDYPLLPMDSINEFTDIGAPEARPVGELLNGYSYLEPTDVAYAKVTPCFENGKGLIGSVLEGPTFATTEVTVLRPHNSVNQRFLGYLLQSSTFRHAAIASMTGAGGLKRVSETAMRDLRVPAPPFEEQELIADYLDRETAEIDALIAEQDALLALLTEHRTSFVDSSLCALGSSKVPLKYRGSLSAGLTLGAVYNEPVSVHPYIRVANVQAGRLDLSRIAEVAVPDRVAETRRLYPGDVLMTEGGDRDKLGRGALWSGEVEGALHQNHVFAFRCGPQLDPQFLVYVLESSEARQYFEATASQSTNLASTNSTLVKRLRIPDVSIQMQHAVVETLDNEIRMIEAASEDAYRLIELAEERRSALISAAVTGQIDVTVQGVSAAEQLRDELVVHV